MNNQETDLIFPSREIASLRNERNAIWRKLVAEVEIKELDTLDKMAFILMMARLNNCATCNADSYRSVRGCSSCAKQSLKRFRGPDDELIRLFKMAKSEVELFIQKPR